MGLFAKLFKKPEPVKVSKPSEHAVIVYFNYGLDALDALYTLEQQLEEAITQAKVGLYDGHIIAMDNSDGYLYMYGPNAEILFKTVHPILTATSFMTNAVAKLRFGGLEEGVPEIEVII